ncbi:tandem-95 repeat protein [Subtercola sp. PAMC28395]|uniref:Ig-like domain-containing protein n=1 Tax=Subtercola sp. PAMC28395 TaxID=2846775 RepID=UPI001C0D4F53|nr:Ig-like domain-containing protein [Subtercola sp. PAMC28395]QWT24557.1 tandem-95 repeat protein [Subtercola sp. PAMC28395]
MLRGILSRRRSLISVAIICSSSLVLALIAIFYQGFKTANVELNDGGVWVTKASGLLVGHLNHQSQVLDEGLRTKTDQFDVLQSGNTVMTVDTADSTLNTIDPAKSVFGGDVTLPTQATVVLGGETTAILEPDTGALYVVPASQVDSFSAKGTDPMVTLGAGSAVAVGPDGAVRAVSSDNHELVVIAPDGVGGYEPATRTSLPQFADTAVLTISAVGANAAIFDSTSSTLYLPGGKTVQVPDAGGAVLQQSGPDSSSVLLATPTQLITQPLDGGQAQRTDAGAKGVPAAPVYLGGCGYAAWSGSAEYVRDCAGDSNDVTAAVPNLQPDSVLRFRVNRDVVVLNDLTSGLMWLVNQSMLQVDNWADVTPPPSQSELDDNADNQDQIANVLPQRSTANTPPVAVDDSFGVRAGRTIILPVLDNDTDADGDILTATLSGSQPSIGTVEPIFGGSQLQVTVNADASGSASFRYKADDGRGGQAEATVTLSVSAAGTNRPPVQKRPSTTTVENGKTTTVNVMADWSDPDGDDLILTGAESSDTDIVTFTPDGKVTYDAVGGVEGRKTIAVSVSDGTDTAKGTLRVDVKAAGSTKPITNGDHFTTTVGQDVLVAPLLNDISPSGVALRLAKVAGDGSPGTTLTPDYAAGTFTFNATAAKTYYVQYFASDGPNTVAGLVRIDVTQPVTSDSPPIAVRDQGLLTTGRNVLVDVLQNDSDPNGGILVVQSVSVPDSAGLTVAVLEHRVLKVSARNAMTGPVTFTYTVSNGVSSSTGDVVIIPVPAPAQLDPPVAVDDTVSVRAGDYVTIPVLANDYDPNGDTITLSPTLVAPLVSPADGDLFVSENTLRFKAGPVAKTVYATYDVMDSLGQKDAGYVTIRILPVDAASNSAPRPLPLTARVLSGTTVRIPVTLTGIDPDGDSVDLVGQGTAPQKGRITEVGDSWLVYEAYAQSTGTDSFTYVVRDRPGASAVGSVLVGIAKPGSTNQNPNAVEDSITVKPGREVAVPVLVNDTDPDGDLLSLVDGSLQPADGVTAEIAKDRVVVSAPDKEGTYSIGYQVADPWGGTAYGVLQVTVSASAPLLAPIARDDRVSAAGIVGQTSVSVNVLTNDEDPDGVADQLSVSSDDPAVTGMSKGSVTIALAVDPQIVLYTVTDPDGLTASAFVLVPGTGVVRPTLKSTVKPVEVKSGQSVELKLSDYVDVAKGKTPRITVANKVTANHANGDALIKDETTLVYTPAADYYGPDAISFEVTDGTGPDDPTGLTSVLVIPITVLAPSNRPPSFIGGTVNVAPGEDPITVNLRAMSKDPDPEDLQKLSYSIDGSVPAGFSLSVDGQNLKASAASDATKGQTGTVTIAVSDGTNSPVTGTLNLSVSASTRPLATTADDIVDNAAQGKAVTVSVLGNDTSPFSGKALTVIGATVETGDGSSTFTGNDVTITPSSTFVGTMVVRYRVQDSTKDPDREVDGRVRLTVKGKPGTPSTPSVTSIQDHTVVLSWTPPVNNGSVITSYTVRSDKGTTNTCASTTCTLSNLTNDVEYTFTVTATNAIGESDPSPASAVARPDARPSAPAPPSLVFGDKSLTVSWNTPVTTGSPVTSYTLEISPLPAFGSAQQTVSGNSTVWTGLENGTAYTVRVQAHNRAPDPSDWSGMSAPMVPAGVPDAPGAPTTSAAQPVGGQAQIALTWSVPNNNGDAIAGYTVNVLQNGAVVNSFAAPSNSANATVSISQTDYTFTVSAKNKAGQGATSGQSDARRAAAPPGAPKNVVATPGDGVLDVTFAAGDLNGSRSDEITYNYSVNGGGSGSVGAGSTSIHIGGLQNGSSYSVQIYESSKVVSQSGPAATSNAVSPFGKPIITLQAVNRQDNAVQFVWNVNSNGSALNSASPGVDGNGNGNQTNGGLQPSQSTSIHVSYSNAAGTSTADWSGNANDPPPMRLWLTRSGDTVTYHWQNVAAGNWTDVSMFRCWNVPPNTQSGNVNKVGSVAGSFSTPNGSITVPCGSGVTDSFSVEPWRNGPWLQINGSWGG